MTDSTKYIDIKEFSEEGYLQELNRIFLQPLGFTLETKIEEDGTEILGGIVDCRHDPEGMVFGAGMIDPEKALRVEKEYLAKMETRQELLGFGIQPTFPDDGSTEPLALNPSEPEADLIKALVANHAYLYADSVSFHRRVNEFAQLALMAMDALAEKCRQPPSNTAS